MRCNFSAVAARVSTAACACDAVQVRLYPDVSHTLTAMYPVPDWHFAWAFTHGRQVCDACNETCACLCDLLSSDPEPFTRPHGRHHSHELQQLFPDGRQCWLRFMYESLNFTATGLGVTCTRATCRRIHQHRSSLTSCCADSEGASDDWNKAMWSGPSRPPVPISPSLLYCSANCSIVFGALSVSVSGSGHNLHLLPEASALWLNCHCRSCSSSLGSTSALLPLRLLCV
jgi:hypothetical protein